MTWGRFDDNFPHHPKARRAGPEACWLFVCGVLHCNRFATDGFIDALDLDVLYPHAEWNAEHLAGLAARLVEVGLWERAKGGWQIHDYADYQREAMKDTRDERRKWEAERKAKQRAAKRGGSTPAEKQGYGDYCPSGTGVGQSHGTGVGHVPGTPVGHDAGTPAGAMPRAEVPVSRPPVPSRPVPNSETETEAELPRADAGAPAAVAALPLILAEAPSKPPRDLDRVFAHWQTATRHPRAVLDARRERAIRAGLKRYSAEDLCRSIDGYARSPFHQGQNDRGTRHDDLTLILRDAAHVEAGWELAQRHAPPALPAAPPVAPPRPVAPRATPEERRAARDAVHAALAPKEALL